MSYPDPTPRPPAPAGQASGYPAPNLGTTPPASFCQLWAIFHCCVPSASPLLMLLFCVLFPRQPLCHLLLRGLQDGPAFQMGPPPVCLGGPPLCAHCACACVFLTSHWPGGRGLVHLPHQNCILGLRDSNLPPSPWQTLSLTNLRLL